MLICRNLYEDFLLYSGLMVSNVLDGFIPCLRGFRKHGSQEWETMHHILPDMQLNVYPCFPGFFRKPDRVIQQDFMVANLD